MLRISLKNALPAKRRHLLRKIAILAATFPPQAKVSIQRFIFPFFIKSNIEVWLSLVERYVRDVEVASSNLVTSTSVSVHKGTHFLYN